MFKYFPQILSLGLSHPKTGFTQSEIAELLKVSGEKANRFFNHKHIENRFLILPKDFQEESSKELADKFKKNSIELISDAVSQALKKAKLTVDDIDYICCVTSTGFVVPGLSALMMTPLKLKNNCQRLDVVGMGCNAGLNGLNAVVSWCKSNPDKKGILVCCEICSSIYSVDQSENAALVNSLFGDGVAAAVIGQDANSKEHGAIIDSESYLIPDTLFSLRFDFDEIKNRYNFFVGKETPLLLAKEIHKPLDALLKKSNLTRDQISHWIVHSGGASILDEIEEKLNLKAEDLRNTRSILKRYGNISSGSFLFSYQELLNEGTVKKGDHGVMITMGPGLTIEMALVKW